MSKKFVIDTNVLLSDPQSILKFEGNDVVIPLVVLEELDAQKSSDRTISRDARAGEYCKVIITGNLGQIDNDFISPRTSGLTYATEKLHGLPFTKVVRLQGVERSRLAEFVEEEF